MTYWSVLKQVTFVETHDWRKEVLYWSKEEVIPKIWEKVKYDITRLLSYQEFKTLETFPLNLLFVEIDRQIGIRKKDLGIKDDEVQEQNIH